MTNGDKRYVRRVSILVTIGIVLISTILIIGYINYRFNNLIPKLDKIIELLETPDVREVK